MESPAMIDWRGDRYVPFVRTLSFVGHDWTGATFAMQVRDRRDGGSLRADLATVAASPSAEGVALLYGGTDTVANHVAAGRLTSAIYSTRNPQTGADYVAGDSVAVSQVRIRIDEATMEAMPFGSEVGTDRELYWDLHVTPFGGVKDLYARGSFTVRAGVTE